MEDKDKPEEDKEGEEDKEDKPEEDKEGEEDKEDKPEEVKEGEEYKEDKPEEDKEGEEKEDKEYKEGEEDKEDKEGEEDKEEKEEKEDKEYKEEKEDKEDKEGEEEHDEFTPASNVPSKPLPIKSEISHSRVKSEGSAIKAISKMFSSVTKVPNNKDNMPSFLSKRNPYTRDPPQLEERRPRIQNPSTPKDYIINLREDLADFQESHGLPRTRDYSFMSLGLALAQEVVRALYSLFLMLLELVPILAIISLLMRFALDKLIDIFETPEPVPKIKKTAIFVVEMVLVIIPIWILFVVIIFPLLTLLLSLLKRTFFRGAKKTSCKPKQKPPTCSSRN